MIGFTLNKPNNSWTTEYMEDRVAWFILNMVEKLLSEKALWEIARSIDIKMARKFWLMEPRTRVILMTLARLFDSKLRLEFCETMAIGTDCNGMAIFTKLIISCCFMWKSGY